MQFIQEKTGNKASFSRITGSDYRAG